MAANKYNRDEFSTYSKDQLLIYIEQQNEQLIKFETRFRDVVKAYKGVVKEKEALESSLRALTSHSSTPNRAIPSSKTQLEHLATPPPSNPITNTASSSDQEVSDTQQSTEGDEQDGEEDSLREQVATLSQALSTLTQEKSKMELSFQQDKKNLLAHQETLTQQYSNLQEETKQHIQQLKQDFEVTKERLTEERKGRREEEDKFSDMLKELQELVNKERNAKESLGKELQSVSSELYSCKRQIANDRTLEYSKTIDSLTEELQRCKLELSEMEKKLHEPSPTLARLQEELKNVKEEHERDLEYERNRVNEAERECQQISQQTEQRVASLESRLSEMSSIVGEHESTKERDQQIIQKLRDRITQLDIENTELTKNQLEASNRISNEAVTQISTLQDKVTKLRQLLKVASQKAFEQSAPPSNLEDMSIAEYSDMLSTQPSKKQYQEELSQLRTEFNSYKKRAQSVLKNKNTKEQDCSKELQEKEQRYEELMRVVEQLRKEREEEREQNSMELQKLRRDMRETADIHRNELMQSELKHKQKLQDLQTHIQTTRERTKNLLEEKDSEITLLRGELQAQRERVSTSSNYVMGSSTASLENSINSNPDVRTASQSSLDPLVTGNAIHELLTQTSVSTGGDVKWFLQTQEQQRVNGEMTSLRRKRLDLEDNLRDFTEREQKHLEQIDVLKMEIRKLERDRSRETENFEYLKNIVLHYMCAESSSRLHLVRPIATVLHFTPNEIDAVEKRLTRGWFTSTVTTPTK